MEEMLWNLGLRNLIGLFHNLEWVCEMKMEEIRGLNMDLNDGWHFSSSLEFASCPISQVDSQAVKMENELVKWHTCAWRCFRRLRKFSQVE